MWPLVLGQFVRSGEQRDERTSDRSLAPIVVGALVHQAKDCVEDRAASLPDLI